MRSGGSIIREHIYGAVGKNRQWCGFTHNSAGKATDIQHDVGVQPLHAQVVVVSGRRNFLKLPIDKHMQDML